ncbi:hypothetical protein ACH5RR_021775 [Cinchona calisaya]|uniref:Uncharacterized protein n=1 Tax=Cinchona calisaya TaxID=153742 RepID=A0ABD2ZI88_9GENT
MNTLNAVVQHPWSTMSIQPCEVHSLPLVFEGFRIFAPVTTLYLQLASNSRKSSQNRCSSSVSMLTEALNLVEFQCFNANRWSSSAS